MTELMGVKMVLVLVFLIREEVFVDVVNGWLRDSDFFAFARLNTLDITHGDTRESRVGHGFLVRFVICVKLRIREIEGLSLSLILILTSIILVVRQLQVPHGYRCVICKLETWLSAHAHQLGVAISGRALQNRVIWVWASNFIISLALVV